MLRDVAGLSDDHVHSTAGSADAVATIEELCQLAVARGLCSICFTEHLDFDVTLPEYGYYAFDTVQRAIAQARERFAGSLEIRMGLEVDFEPRFAEEIPGALSKLPVDFVLGSVHVYQGLHFALYREAGRAVMSAEELSALYRRYFADVRAMIRTGYIDCIGHLDYPAKVGIRTADGAIAPAYAEEMEETLALAVAHGIGLEINTKRSHAGAPLAAPESAIRRYVALGGRLITLGSDTHRCEQLADGLDLGVAVLRRAGLEYQTVFRERKAERIPLSW